MQQFERFLAEASELKDHTLRLFLHLFHHIGRTNILTLYKLSSLLKILQQTLHLLFVDGIVVLILLAGADVLMQEMGGFE